MGSVWTAKVDKSWYLLSYSEHNNLCSGEGLSRLGVYKKLKDVYIFGNPLAKVAALYLLSVNGRLNNKEKTN